MRKNIFKLYVLLLIFILISISFLSYKKIVESKVNILSPLPNFLTAFANNQVSTLNLWQPFLETFNSPFTAITPFITARSALIYDLNNQKVLFSKNSRERLPMASLTKIMTAVVALESSKKDDKYAVTSDDLVGEDSMGVSQGEVLSLGELLYGLILPSGNDAAETMASNYPAGRIKFIEAMNNKAKALGLENTHFTNPTGLEGDGKQYTTAYDLLVITNYAMQFPLFKKVVGTFDYHIPYSGSHKEYYLENETNLLTSYPGGYGRKGRIYSGSRTLFGNVFKFQRPQNYWNYFG